MIPQFFHIMNTNEPDRHQEASDEQLLEEHAAHPERFRTVTENPKEAAGRKKCPMHLLSPSAMRATADALGHGKDKYGPRNYRAAGINATTYVGAILRHITAWNDGEDLDLESGLSHVAHVSACCDILLDCMGTGMMTDDRSKMPAGLRNASFWKLLDAMPELSDAGRKEIRAGGI